MIVVVAEKYTVARLLADTLFQDGVYSSPAGLRGKLDGGETIITWPEGHCLELAKPQMYKPEWATWRLDSLPIYPEGFKFKLMPRNQERLDAIMDALSKASSLVNACDSAQEGELIFDEIAQYAGTYDRRIPITRLWLSDTTGEGIRSAWASRLRHEDHRLRNLRVRANARAQADWLWGINLSRYVTISLGKTMELRSESVSIGRVMTPLLAIISKRCNDIAYHQPVDFWRAYIDVANEEEEIVSAQLLAPAEYQFGVHDTDWSDRVELNTRLQHIRLSYATYWTVKEGESKTVREFPPTPFDTIDLQRTANKLLGWSPKETDEIAQSLYMKGFISYPRTESCKIPESMRPHIMLTHARLWSDWLPRRFPNEIYEIPQMVLEPERLFADKVGDHYAIIPTGDSPQARGPNGSLSDEYLLWQLITLRFLAAPLAPARILATSRVFELPYLAGETLRALVKVAAVQEASWLKFEDVIGATRADAQPLAERLEAKVLPPMKYGQAAYRNAYGLKRQTTPPEYFTYDMLLYAMQKNGLGTAATRTSHIEKLLKLGYIAETKTKRIVTTDDGEKLIGHLLAHGGETMCDPKLTQFWEGQLDNINKPGAKGREREPLLKDIIDQVVDLGSRMVAPALVDEVVFCPRKGVRVQEREDGYVFAGWPEIVCPRKIAQREMKKSEYRDILMSGRKGAGPYEGFRFRQRDASEQPQGETSGDTAERSPTFTAHLVYSTEEKRFKFLRKRSKKRPF